MIISNMIHRVLSFPQLVSGQDFGLGNPITNKEFLEKLLKDSTYKTVKFAGQTFHKVNWGNLEIGLFLTDGEFIVYYVQLKTLALQDLGPVVVQTIVWRSLTDAPYGITSKVFKYILNKYQIIASDKVQTERGREFWITRLSEAFNSGNRIGLWSNGTLVDIDTKKELKDYVNEKHILHPWGKAEHFGNFRFVIFKEKRIQ